MGGRGSNLNLSGIPRHKRKALRSYEKHIDKHKQKIIEAIVKGKNLDSIGHWEKEILAAQENIQNIYDRRDRKRGKKNE